MPTQVDMKALYEQDFYQWLLATTNLLKSRQLTMIDWDNLIEEIDGLAREEVGQLYEHLEEIFHHLLIFQKPLISLEDRDNVESHRSKLSFGRIQLKILLESSPSLEEFWDEQFEQAYQDSREVVSVYYGLPKDTFPEDPLFTKEQVLDFGYLPCQLP
ncbi:DUF29 domain-containing protein [Synechocystis sp. CACIAM 05]|uniref:DUF29 domain-containing protein n=1 Tax=Synechocystis sp. CACIAM 05 TaxID=1933929 RepID=UPI0013916146|nr:DUF29 domain-containing protein [Synechocystis sp. CACIAM 05]